MNVIWTMKKLLVRWRVSLTWRGAEAPARAASLPYWGAFGEVGRQPSRWAMLARAIVISS
jgi:hypothetical protein